MEHVERLPLEAESIFYGQVVGINGRNNIIAAETPSGKLFEIAPDATLREIFAEKKPLVGTFFRLKVLGLGAEGFNYNFSIE